VYDRDEDLDFFSFKGRHVGGSPLYYAAFCGLYDLTERLIEKHPEQVNAVGGRIVAPLLAALHRRHFQVADLLLRHGAAVDVRGLRGRTLLHRVSMDGQIDVMRWLLNHGADVHSRENDLWTPLHLAAANDHPEAVQVLLDHNADVNLRNNEGNPPLHEAFLYPDFFPDEKTVTGIVRRLLERGADPNTCDDNHSNSTPLHVASSQGWLKVARLLLSHGANVDEKDKGGRTPFQVASAEGHVEMTELLLDSGANPEP
jgi:ankyrin repeat protein